MSNILSSYSCSYDYNPPLVTRSVAFMPHSGDISGVQCWSSTHLVFACLAGISFVPTYLGMLYFNLVHSQPHQSLKTHYFQAHASYIGILAYIDMYKLSIRCESVNPSLSAKPSC